MNSENIKEIISAFEQSSLYKMELQTQDMKIKMEKGQGGAVVTSAPDELTAVVAQPAAPTAEKQETKKAEGTWVKAPIVGTYYNARSATSKPFVEINQHVKKGDVLCIIEAMKVMNEIHAPKDGVILEILVTNESMVEFDQELIRIGEAV